MNQQNPARGDVSLDERVPEPEHPQGATGGGHDAGHLGFGLALLVAAALYRPLVLWADNAWEVAAPTKLLFVGLAVAAIVAVPYLLLARLAMRPAAAAIGLAGLIFVAMNWHRLEPSPYVWLGASSVLAWAVGRFASREADRIALTVGVAVLLVAPGAQLGLAHAQQSQPYPIGELAERHPAEATGLVEDVLVVVVDSYPAIWLAEDWFSHDTAQLRSALSGNGYVVEPAGWSPYTFTGLAVPSLLELKPIVEPGPKGQWGHRMSNYSIIQGDSLVAANLTSAGYNYTHIESGWHAGACGAVDVCLESSWVDEETWELLRPGIAASPMDDRLGSHAVRNSLRVVTHLESIATSFDDGELDFVFAHMLLPHPPLVVDADCNVIERDARFDQSMSIEERLSAQLACSDSLIERISDVTGSRTAVIITGDHGTATLGQNSKPSEEWTDADVAERLGVFLAYHLPEGCSPPESPVNIDVMRAIVSCAVTSELPERDTRFMIGADEPTLIDAARMAHIQEWVDAQAVSTESG